LLSQYEEYKTLSENVIVKNTDSMLKSIFKFSISTWINFFISLFTAIITTRVFTPDIYGIINVFNTTSATIMSIICLGLDSSYIRFFNEPPAGNNSKQLTFKLISVSVSITAFVGVIISAFLYQPFTQAIFSRTSWLLSVMVFINVLSLLLLRFLNITYRMSFNVRQFTIQSILVQIFSKLFVVAAALFNPTAEVVISFNVLGVFILTVVYIFLQRKDIIPRKIDFDFTGYKPIFKYAFFTAPIYIAINLNGFFSQQIIAQTISLGAVGIYSTAYYFSTIISVLQAGFTTYWSAFMFSNYEKDRKKITGVHDYIMLFLIVAFIGMIIFKDLIYLLIGPQYQESKNFFALVSLYPILGIAAETTTYGMAIVKKNHITLINYTIAILVNLLSSIILTKQFGLTGTAAASCFSAIVLFALNTFWGQKYYKSISSIKRTVLCVVMIVVAAFSATLVKNTIIYASIIITIIIVSITIYLPQIKVILGLILIIAKTKFNKNKEKKM